ncbi:hypothetical protein LR48_Vigan03g214700 [Vigna angularis]|uniref:DUF7780 domain-containing protein n=2 Tax=Phaseolus angularis TaxID=3914 RepID=A0A0L9U7I0_PHAAN|nr:uncharacterized protein LOC108327875 [Vigna angularis]KOM38765.1 hypothetical protein LR48_Vigan03g214700 [Vigna angularis]
MTVTKPNMNNNSNNNNSSGIGMGMLLVLFSQDNKSSITDKPKLTLLSPSKTLLSKAQSTISICLLLFFTTLLLFTLSTFPNTSLTTKPTSHALSHTLHTPFALQRMGTLHRRGTKSMSDLLISHVPDDTPLDDFRLFLRLLHRSYLTASSDVVFLFPSPSSSSKFTPIISQENHAFSTLLHLHARLNSTRLRQLPKSSFHPNRFRQHQQQQKEPLWGPKTKTNLTASSLGYGSVLSFHASELDPENSLAGFLDRVPLSLRRWACYPMLLGRVRRTFKHVILADVKTLLILKDPFARLKTPGPNSVLVFSKQEKHGKKTQRVVLSSVIIGGARGVRRLSGAMAVEIVRAATQHRKRKNPVTEYAILSQLVGGSGFVLKNKNVDLVASSETIPEAGGSSPTSFWDFAMVQRGVSNYDLNYVIRRQMCSSVLDSSVYRDC